MWARARHRPSPAPAWTHVRVNARDWQAQWFPPSTPWPGVAASSSSLRLPPEQAAPTPDESEDDRAGASKGNELKPYKSEGSPGNAAGQQRPQKRGARLPLPPATASDKGATRQGAAATSGAPSGAREPGSLPLRASPRVVERTQRCRLSRRGRCPSARG